MTTNDGSERRQRSPEERDPRLGHDGAGSWRRSTTYHEICSQPSVWADVIDSPRIERVASWIRETDSHRVVIVGCGSSFYLACAAACALNEVSRIPALALPAGEAVTSWRQHVAPEEATLLIAVSRSGATSEVLWAIADHRKHRRGKVCGVTTAADSPLAAVSDESLILPEAAEQSVLMTRSFSTMLLALDAIALRLGGYPLSTYRMLPSHCREVIDVSEELTRQIVDQWPAVERIFVLGSGAAYGVAREGALKLLEGSLTVAEAFRHLEFRHGPKALVDAEAMIVSLATRDVADFEPALAEELLAYGGRIVRTGRNGLSAVNVPMPACPDAYSEALSHLPLLQLLALARAEAQGVNPDRPPHLDAVVKLARPTHPDGAPDVSPKRSAG